MEQEIIPGSNLDQKTLDEQKAREFFIETLPGEQLIEIPQNPNCEVAVVVPVYTETSERILAQILSLTKQREIGKENFEALYVINNGEDNGSEEFQSVRRLNQQILNLPIWKNREADYTGCTPEQQTLFEELRENFNLFAIDKSSPDNAIASCTVGKARGRGVAEASRRFFDNQKNGVLVQTDADARFEDQDYLKKAINAFQEDPSIIGIAGDILYEFSPDEETELTSEQVREKWIELVLLKTAKRLSQFTDKLDNEIQTGGDSHDDIAFSGANMITKSYETAVAGGISDQESGEDTEFSQRLNQFAQERGKRVTTMPDSLKVVTALRESGRTPVRLKTFYGITLSGDPLVEDPDVRQRTFVPLRELYTRLVAKARTTDKGRRYLEYLYQRAPLQFRDPTGANDFSFLQIIEAA